MPADPLGQVERTYLLFEKGPQTVAAAMFALAFFFALWLLLRAKDKHLLAIERVKADGEKREQEHQAELARLYVEDRERAVKLELTLHRFLDYVETQTGRTT